MAQVKEKQQKLKSNLGYYGEWARCRNLSLEEVQQQLTAGQPYTVRFRSPDGPPRRIVFEDLIRGPLEQPDNVIDTVLLKSSDQSLRLPTYHFAHAVDDHLMRVNLVLRGEDILAGLSPKMVSQIKAKIDTSTAKDSTGLSAGIASIVKKPSFMMENCT